MFPEFELKEGWATVFLLLLVLTCVAMSIQHADWTEGLTILQGVVLLGGGLGILLAKSRTPSRTAHLLAGLSGFTWAAFLTSTVLAEALELSPAAAVVELDWRLQTWVYVLFSRQTAGDNYVFVFLLSVLMWLVAYASAWAIFRWQRVWWAVIICGVALTINTIYAPVKLTTYLIAFLVFALLLVVRANLATYQQEWRRARVQHNSELVYSFLRAGFSLSLLAILLAWITPKAVASRPLGEVWDKLGEPWRRIQDQSSRVFHDLNYQNEQAYIHSGRSMTFGGAVDLPDTPVMDVSAPMGRYWRVMAYHEYDGSGWDNTDADTILIPEGKQLLAVPPFGLRREMTQTVTLQRDLGPDGLLATAAQPLRAALPLRAILSLVGSAQDAVDAKEAAAVYSSPGDPSALYAREPLKKGQSYQVYSSVSMADAESLRGAGTDYPAWIVPRYLQLPNSLPDRVSRLAEQVADDLPTPYDKALAIEGYLRELPYNDQIPGPELTQDGVDYFLFDQKEGYCEYYASSMVVMLRAVGVPARYVEGYSQGKKEGGAYRVLESNGHAWPEVFFPGYGWVEFEPTAGEPALVRPSSPPNLGEAQILGRDEFQMDEALEDERLNAGANSAERQPTPPPETSSSLPPMGRVGWLTLDLAALGLVLVVLLHTRRQRQIEGLSVAERVYMDLVAWVARLLKIDQRPHQTPLEFAGVVAEAVPQGGRAVKQVAHLYVQERFGGKLVLGDQAEVAWSESWRALWRRWVERRVDAVRRIWWRLVPPEHLAEE